MSPVSLLLSSLCSSVPLFSPHCDVFSGLIDTDMTRSMIEQQGDASSEAEIKSPADGAVVPVELVSAEAHCSGRFYGSDGVRSPLHRPREPDSAPFRPVIPVRCFLLIHLTLKCMLHILGHSIHHIYKLFIALFIATSCPVAAASCISFCASCLFAWRVMWLYCRGSG